MRLSQTNLILLGLVLGVCIGAMIHSAGSNPEVLAWLSLPGKLFLNLIKCIVAPLVFTMLVVGIGGASDLHSVGRMGLRTMSYFLVVTSLALLVGLAAVNLTHPGVGVNLPAEVDEGVRLISATAERKKIPKDTGWRRRKGRRACAFTISTRLKERASMTIGTRERPRESS